MAFEKRFLRSLADDVGDQEGFGGGSAARNTGGGSVAHVATNDFASLGGKTKGKSQKVPTMTILVVFFLV